MAGVLLSFLDPDPDGEGRVPLPFFGRMVPLFTVGRNGRVAIIGLAGGNRTTTSGVFRTNLDSRPLSNCCVVIKATCEREELENQKSKNQQRKEKGKPPSIHWSNRFMDIIVSLFVSLPCSHYSCSSSG